MSSYQPRHSNKQTNKPTNQKKNSRSCLCPNKFVDRMSYIGFYELLSGQLSFTWFPDFDYKCWQFCGLYNKCPTFWDLHDTNLAIQYLHHKCRAICDLNVKCLAIWQTNKREGPCLKQMAHSSETWFMVYQMISTIRTIVKNQIFTQLLFIVV